MKPVYVLFLFYSLGAQEIPGTLRGGIEVDRATIDLALVMQAQGWEYVMPIPKSPQAKWGNRDGRTTWWLGYWRNTKSRETSARPPKSRNGRFVGDGGGGRVWRRGGSPRRPTKLEWLLSKRGGVKPGA